MRRPSSIHVPLAAALLAPLAARAAVPVQLRHSGYVLTASDTPLDATSVPFAFTLWDDAGAGTQVWPESGAAACTQDVRAGYFAVSLGDGTCGAALTTDHLPPGGPRWLAVTVDGVPLSPRVRLDVAPAAALAARALEAEKLGGLARAGFLERTDDLANARYDASFTLAQKLGQLGSGSVTSVGLALPSVFAVSGSPVTTSGTLTATFAQQAEKTVLAAPAAGAGSPAFRTLATTDLADAATALVRPGGNTLGSPLALGTTDAQPLQLLTQGSPRVSVTAAGLVGIGTADPKAALDVNGGVRVGSMGENDCAPATEGALRYVSTAPKRLQLCNGSAWQNVSGTPDGTNASNAGFSCKSIKDAGFSTGDGPYWINAPGVATYVYCDMTTDGGGWTLVGFSQAGTPHRNMYSLKCGGGAYHPTNRNDSGAINAVALARASTEVAFAQTSGSSNVTGNMLAYAVVTRFAIPNPSQVTFDAHSYHTGYAAQTCTPVTVSYLKGGTGTLARYTLNRSLGATWTDSYPTGYGAVTTSNCTQTYSAGPYTQSIHSGAGRGTNNPAISNCDVTDGSLVYNHQGIYLPTTVAAVGTTAIWLR